MKCSGKFFLPCLVGSLMSSVMARADVKLYLSKTMYIVKATAKRAFPTGLRLHLNVF